MDYELGIIIPFRDRHNHLEKLVPCLASHLNGINAVVLVVEQQGSAPFNKGRLLNAGYDYIKSKAEWICLHDVDFLPANVFCDYSRPTTLRQAIKYAYSDDKPDAVYAVYSGFMGGVCLCTKDVFEIVNGYSNCYNGWGGEDDDFYLRTVLHGIPCATGRGFFKNLSHDRLQCVCSEANALRLKATLRYVERYCPYGRNPADLERLIQWAEAYPDVPPLDPRDDGLNNLRYHVVAIGEDVAVANNLGHLHYQHIYVEKAGE